MQRSKEQNEMREQALTEVVLANDWVEVVRFNSDSAARNSAQPDTDAPAAKILISANSGPRMYVDGPYRVEIERGANAARAVRWLRSLADSIEKDGQELLNLEVDRSALRPRTFVHVPR